MLYLSIAVLSGAAMYGYFANCDPLKSKKIEKPDQMLPYMVLEIFQDLPGMAGLFVVTVFSGTMRYGINIHVLFISITFISIPSLIFGKKLSIC